MAKSRDSLSILDLHHLKALDRYFMSDCYWEDDIIRRFRELGLVSRDGGRIVLTDAGRQAQRTTAPSLSSNVVEYRDRTEQEARDRAR